jgi:hypothetical protein
MAGQKREARLRDDDPAIHQNKKAGSDPGLFLFFASPRLRGEAGTHAAKRNAIRVRGIRRESHAHRLC